MNVNNDLQGLQQLFASQEITAAATKAGSGTTEKADAGTDEATLSTAASLAAQAAPDSDVRTEKVAQIQQALASGTYSVPSSAVAGRMMDAMLGK